MILRENNEWLRYIFWACAIGLCVLFVNAINAPVRDTGKILGTLSGVLLFGFSGLVYRSRKVKIDPHRRKITITSKGLRQTFCEVLDFSEVERIVVLESFTYESDLLPANRWQKNWTLALACRGRIVPVTLNPSVSKDEAMHDAVNIRLLLGVEISNSTKESISGLAKSGRKVEAITLAERTLGMTTSDATNYVENDMKPSGSSGRPDRIIMQRVHGVNVTSKEGKLEIDPR
jgi:hypothetical protein